MSRLVHRWGRIIAQNRPEDHPVEGFREGVLAVVLDQIRTVEGPDDCALCFQFGTY